MMEYKFRAWDKKKRKMLYLSPNDTILFKNGKCTVWKENQYDKIEECCCCETFNDVIPMLYTGRKDKNKEEIYEGDILTCPHIANYKPCVVKFGIHNDAYNGWYVDWGNMQGELNESWSDMGVKIGNIWENPELLKEVE